MLYKSARSRAMRRPMSQLNRNLFSAREEERLLRGALGCAIPNSSRASGPPTRRSALNWNCGAHGARAREDSERSGAPSWRKSRRLRKRVQSGNESKSADRSIAPSGLRPTKHGIPHCRRKRFAAEALGEAGKNVAWPAVVDARGPDEATAERRLSPCNRAAFHTNPIRGGAPGGDVKLTALSK
jgi:hypothetical protein